MRRGQERRCGEAFQGRHIRGVRDQWKWDRCDLQITGACVHGEHGVAAWADVGSGALGCKELAKSSDDVVLNADTRNCRGTLHLALRECHERSGVGGTSAVRP
jgi:hypothetical protein